jgi:hypothetical protein
MVTFSSALGLLFLLTMEYGYRVMPQQCETPALWSCTCVEIEMGGLFLTCNFLPFEKKIDSDSEERLHVLHILVTGQGLRNGVIKYNRLNWPRLQTLQHRGREFQCYFGKCRPTLLHLITIIPSSMESNDGSVYESITPTDDVTLTTLIASPLNKPNSPVYESTTPVSSDVASTILNVTDEVVYITPTDIGENGKNELVTVIMSNLTMDKNISATGWFVSTSLERESYFIIGFGCSLGINVVLTFVIIYISCKAKLQQYHTTNTDEMEMPERRPN